VTFSRFAVVVDLVDLDGPVTRERLLRELEWARTFASRLGAPPPAVSMSVEQALARAESAIAARTKYSDEDVDFGLAVVTPKGKLFPGKKVWDAAYSAGFTWGDGDYFHWVPSPNTDVSQGIWMATSTSPGYFLPEALLAEDGSADLSDLGMWFNAARCWQPTSVFDVMSRAASYLARRLGGTVAKGDRTPLDVETERARVAAIEKGLVEHGLTPGHGMALRVF